jgi:hypothetical protein
MGGTEIDLQGSLESWKDVACMYENDDAQVPCLSESGVQIIGDFLREQGCVMIGGYIPGEAELPMGKVVGMLRSYNAPDPATQTFRGPHIMGDSESWVYHNQGVGIWEVSSSNQGD